jgi:hypothetical protein
MTELIRQLYEKIAHQQDEIGVWKNKCTSLERKLASMQYNNITTTPEAPIQSKFKRKNAERDVKAVKATKESAAAGSASSMMFTPTMNYQMTSPQINPMMVPVMVMPPQQQQQQQQQQQLPSLMMMPQQQQQQQLQQLQQQQQQQPPMMVMPQQLPYSQVQHQPIVFQQQATMQQQHPPMMQQQQMFIQPQYSCGYFG